MEEPRDAPPLGIVHDRIEPLGLQRLLALSAIEEQRVETDETIALDVHPPVGVEMGAPALEQNFVAHRPDQVWLADITQIATSEGWLYLAVILDLFTRKVVGWAMREHMRAELTIAALIMAIRRRRPGAGLIHHSDRGSQGGFN